MVIVNKKHVEIGILKSGQFNWKAEWCNHLDNLHRVENGKDFKFLNTWSCYVPTTIQLFWLKFIFYIKIKPEVISGKTPIKLVKFEDTHLQLMNLPEGNWNDK